MAGDTHRLGVAQAIRASGADAVNVPPSTKRVLATSARMMRTSHGAFAPALGSPKQLIAKMLYLANERYGLSINPKTVSNILWKLKEEGKARSEGHQWFPKDEKQNGSPSLEGEPS